MSISLIASVAQFKGKLAIGRQNELLLRLPLDMKHFSNLTSNILNSKSSIDRNVVVMGRRTWYSLPSDGRPLPNRINIVLTKDKDLHKISPYPVNPFHKWERNVYFFTFEQFVRFYKKTHANVFVIGGSEIFELFLQSFPKEINKIYLTEIYNYQPKNGLYPDTYTTCPMDDTYKLISMSSKHFDFTNNVSYRFLVYAKTHKQHEEHQFLELCKTILENGFQKIDRTGVGTISSFGHQLRFDISESVPLLTTKKVAWRHCIEELLWFLRGDTDARILQRKGVNIWNGNSSREFLDSQKLFHYDTGILGPIYSWQWRFFGASYSQAFADTSTFDRTKVGGIDQIELLIHALKTEPFSRRHVVSAWNPTQLCQMALPPCHMIFTFYVEEDSNGQKHLSCHFVMRSNDMGCGTSFNLFSYCVLTYIIALKCNMKPKTLVYSCSDAHIYKNHVDAIVKQTYRIPRPFPKLLLNPNIKTKEFNDIDLTDFELVGYFPHPSIPMLMAV